MSDKKKIKEETKTFNDSYLETEKEIIILTNARGGSAGKSGQALLWTASVSFIAYYDCETDELIEVSDRVEWLAEDSQRGKWIHDLKGESIYRLKVRPRKAAKQEDYQELLNSGALKALPDFQHRFMLVEVLERNVSHRALEELLVEYRKPVIFSDKDCGDFELIRDLKMFKGSLNWLGKEITAFMYSDEENEKTANDCLVKLKLLMQNQANWDAKLRKFAAEELTDLANDWLEDEDAEAITPESFSKRMTISELAVHHNGDFDCYFDDDDMFWGHVILIEGNVDGTFSAANIAG